MKLVTNKLPSTFHCSFKQYSIIGFLALSLVVVGSPSSFAQESTQQADAKQMLIQTRKENVRKQMQLNKLEKELLEAKARILELQKSNQVTQDNPEEQLEGIDLDEQKKRIQEMITAQSQMTKENSLLSQELEKKSQELKNAQSLNSDLEQKVQQMGGDIQTIFATIMNEPSETVSQEDQKYIKVLDFMAGKADISEAFSPETVDALTNSTDTDVINRENIANQTDVDSIANQIASKVNQLMLEQQSENTTAQTQTSVSNSDSQYAESLTEVADERINETRWITVKSGDTLWAIAQRAYGLGHMYPRIFEANPAVLDDPHRIRPNQRLRVPI